MTTVNACTRQEITALATALLNSDDNDVAQRLHEWRQNVADARRQRVANARQPDPPVRAIRVEISDAPPYAVRVGVSMINCTICDSHHQARNPGQHFRTKRHLRAAATAGEYCSLECTFRQRHERVLSAPIPAEPKDIDLIIRCGRSEFVCHACGGAIRPWQPDQ